MAQTLVIFLIGSLLRPIPGAIVGHRGDRFGRKKVFLVTVLGMALATRAIGLMPTHSQIGVAAPILLLVLRILQGMAIAGEFAGAAVFVAEHVPRRRVGAAIGPMMAGTYSGHFLASVVGAGIVRPARAPLVSLFRDYWRRLLIVAGAGSFLGSTVITVYVFTPAADRLQGGGSPSADRKRLTTPAPARRGRRRRDWRTPGVWAQLPVSPCSSSRVDGPCPPDRIHRPGWSCP